MENPVGRPAGAVDSTHAPNASTMKLPPVQVSQCHCRKPHRGHEPKNTIAQVEALCLNKTPSNDATPSISQPSTPGTTASTSLSTRPAQASNTPCKMSSSNGMVDTRQKERNEQVGEEIKDLEEELCSYCFSSFFPTFQDGDYRERMETLPLLTPKKFKLTSPSALHPGTREPWPIGSNEKLYYSPFASLLNEIVNHFNEIINPNNSKTARFIMYNKPMAPVTSTSLKPDLLLVEENLVNLDPFYWKHPIMPIEVKNDFGDALKQIGTYAREMFAARPGRQICWALYFNHSESTFHVILFTPDRVHYTQPTGITSAVGYREMVKVIIALLSQPGLLTIGEDTSRDSLTKVLPNGDRLEIQEVEFDRKSLVGRKTRIMSVTVVGRDGKGVESTASKYGDSPASIRKPGRTRNPPISLKREVFTKKTPEGSASAATLPSSSQQSRIRSTATSPEKQVSATSTSVPSQPSFQRFNTRSAVTSPKGQTSAVIPPSSFPRLNTSLAVTSPKGQASTTSPSAAIRPPSYQRPRTRSTATSHNQNEGDLQLNLRENTDNLEADLNTLKELQRNPDETLTFAEKVTSLEIGEHLVIKESWPLSSRQDIEWDALQSCSGEFGVPTVVYKVTGKHPMPVECTQEARVPQHIALREKGTRLQDAESPRILLTAVLHAVIGHWNLFQKGWLHRDVSIGNVLMLSEHVVKSPPTGLKGFEDFAKCRGMLIDGDAMIHATSDRKLGDHRLCTPPFLSRRLVDAWVLEDETFDQYFDDLESFAWVLLWALLEIAEKHNGATKLDRTMMLHLNGNDLDALRDRKEYIVSKLKRLSEDIARSLSKGNSTSLLDAFIVLLDQWFDLVKTKARCGNTGTLPSSEESTLFYKDFITFAKVKLEELPEKWNF